MESKEQLPYRCGNRLCDSKNISIKEEGALIIVHCDACHANTTWDKFIEKPRLDPTQPNWGKNLENIMGRPNW